MTLTELKAQAYDCMAIIEQYQTKLNETNKAIAQTYQEQPQQTQTKTELTAVK